VLEIAVESGASEQVARTISEAMLGIVRARLQLTIESEKPDTE
jgi:hypothetical protein